MVCAEERAQLIADPACERQLAEHVGGGVVTGEPPRRHVDDRAEPLEVLGIGHVVHRDELLGGQREHDVVPVAFGVGEGADRAHHAVVEGLDHRAHGREAGRVDDEHVRVDARSSATLPLGPTASTGRLARPR